MGRYDEVDPEELERHLVRVAKLILQLEDEGELLRAAPRLQKLLGDLRQRLFAYEIRSAANLEAAEEPGEEDEPSEEDGEDTLLGESSRVVREAIEREKELREELDAGSPPPEEEEEED